MPTVCSHTLPCTQLLVEHSVNAKCLSQGFEKLQKDIAEFLNAWPSWEYIDVGLRSIDSEIEALQNSVVECVFFPPNPNKNSCVSAAS